MRIARSPAPSVEDLHWLRKQASSAIAPKRLAERCRIVLLSAEGKNHEQIAAALGISRQKALRWRARFVESGRAGLENDAPGCGRKAGYGAEMQALDRTPPGLPLKKGRAGTMTHDYVRHGTTTLFAALNVADGTLIGPCQDRHRHQEWLKFLQQIDAETPADRALHLILDNYATHKHPKVKKWLARHPRFHLHFTPTSASWRNMVERFFRDLTVNRRRRGVFHSVPELVAALEKYLAQHNREPKPFIWTAKANDILAKVARAQKKLPRKPASR